MRFPSIAHYPLKNPIRLKKRKEKVDIIEYPALVLFLFFISLFILEKVFKFSQNNVKLLLLSAYFMTLLDKSKTILSHGP